MENMQKALIMAGSVFMFVIAISVAIFSYNTVREVNNSILTSSENNARTAEYFIANTEDVERYATRAEVIMAILGMESNGYVADKIVVGSETFRKEDFTQTERKNKIEKKLKNIKEGNYSISYKFDESSGKSEVTMTYTLMSI